MTSVPDLEIVVPVHNEQRVLSRSVLSLYQHVLTEFDLSFQITIADNASLDATPGIGRTLEHELGPVRFRHLAEKGRGRALRTAWGASDAVVVAYMDVDLSTDLSCLADLVEPLLAGRADLAIGSRLAPGSRVERGLKRELISRGYNGLLRMALDVGFSDAQCGFKAARREAIRPLLPQVQDDGWFFDTELLVMAERAGLAIHEVPVRWVDDPDSRVRIVRTAWEDVKGIARLRRTRVEPTPATAPPAHAAF